MSKGYNPKVVVPVKQATMFTNSAGETYPIRGLSPLLPEKIRLGIQKEFEAEGKSLEIPTYEIKTVAGDKEIHQHNEQTIASASPEEKEAWSAYLQNRSDADREYNSRIMKALFMGIIVTPTQEWRDEMKFLGVPLETPGSPEEKYSFIETQIISGPQDLADLMMAVFGLAGLVSKEALEEVSSTFQRSMEDAFTEAGRGEAAEK